MLALFNLQGTLICAELSRAQVILDLNCDCVEDTIVVASNETARTGRIKTVVWGSRQRGIGCDTSWYTSRSTNFRNKTLIDIPNWIDVRTSLSVSRINNDSYPDLVIAVRGRERRTALRTRFQRSDTANTEVDTSFTFVIYAQRGLDSVQSIDVSTEVSAQPFTAKRLVFDSDFEDRQLLSSGFTVGRLMRSSDATNVPASSLVARGEPACSPLRLSVFPNPNLYGLVHVRIEDTPDDVYQVVIRDAIGQIVGRSRVNIAQGIEPQADLLLLNVSTGVYAVEVLSSDHRLRQSSLLSVVR